MARIGIKCLVEKYGHKLQFLDLSENNLTDDEIGPLKEATQLRKLSLDNNFLSENAVASLGKTLGLEFLSAKPSPFFTEDLLSQPVVLQSPEFGVAPQLDLKDDSQKTLESLITLGSPFTPQLDSIKTSDGAGLGKRKAKEFQETS